jgi:hypothetical protein
LQSSLDATEEARGGLEAERARMETSFNEAQSAIPRLKAEAATITFQIDTLRRQITNKLAQMEQRAHDNVGDHHKLPFWKKGLGVLSVVADLVPVGQPTVGRIGEGLKLLAQVNPDKPLESAKAIAPQAFAVMTNKNIKVCFGTNAPPITMTNAPGTTNSPGTTNAVNKARKDRVKQATECAKFLGGELKELAAIFKDAQVDDKELAAELEKLKASDTEFQAIVAQAEVLNATKARFAQELAAALQIIGSFSGALAEKLVATHELEDRISANLEVLDHGALLHIKEMEPASRTGCCITSISWRSRFNTGNCGPSLGTCNSHALTLSSDCATSSRSSFTKMPLRLSNSSSDTTRVIRTRIGASATVDESQAGFTPKLDSRNVKNSAETTRRIEPQDS